MVLICHKLTHIIHLLPPRFRTDFKIFLVTVSKKSVRSGLKLYCRHFYSYELVCSLRSSGRDLPDVPNSSNRHRDFAFSGLRLSNTPPEEFRPTKSISLKKKPAMKVIFVGLRRCLLSCCFTVTTLYSYPSIL